MSKGHYTQGTTAEYNDACRIIGGSDAALVYAGTDPAEQTVASLTPKLLTLAAGLIEVGGQVTVQPEQVELAVAKGTPLAATITLSPGKITLVAGLATLTLSATEGISLSFPGTSIQLQMGGKLAVNALMMDTTATNHQVTATMLTETVSGTATRSAASAMLGA